MLAFAKLTSIHTLRNLIKLTRNYSAGKKLPAPSTGCCGDEIPNNCLPFSMACKVALVHGGESGIGYAIAGQLLMDGAKHVVISGNNCDQGTAAMTCLNNSFGYGKVCYIPADVNDKAQLDDVFRTTIHTYGRLDCVVNSMGIFDGENWECELMTNLIGTIRSNVLSYRYMSFENKGCGGVILNVAGIHGFDILSSAPTTCASQHAIVGLTRSFGHPRNSKRSGLRFVTLCPGMTLTNFLKDSDRKAMSDDMGTDLKQYLCHVCHQNPECVGLAGLYLINCAKSGSVWVCEDSKLYKLKIPKRSCYSTLERDFV